MRRLNNLSDIPQLDNVRILPQADNTYEVYFDFLPIPVNMNKGYLDVIIKDLQSDSKHQMTA